LEVTEKASLHKMRAIVSDRWLAGPSLRIIFDH